MRLRRPGLRWTLVLALVATSGLTLVVAVLALVPPLQDRLAQDRLNALRQAAVDQRVTLQDLSADQLARPTAETASLARALQRQTGARIALFNGKGVELADTDPDRTDPDQGLERTEDAALAQAHVRHTELKDGEAVVVQSGTSDVGAYTLVLRKPLGDTRAAFAIVRSGLPVAAATALTIALLVGILVSFRLLRRLERLRRNVRRLHDEGIDEPLPADGTADEVGEVSRAVEAMRARLSSDEQRRQAFLSTASHEMRTPVASLQGTLELLEEELARGDADPEAVERRAQSATRQARRLARLTSDLLDLSRLDGAVAVRREPIELREVAESVAGEFDVPVPEVASGAWAMADAPAVAHIVRILLDNALSYAPESVPIVAFGEADGGVWLQVSDEGPGVAPGEAERIFTRFERGSAGVSRPGFGLGLSIARELARRMDGNLVVLDERPGATFRLSLPAAS